MASPLRSPLREGYPAESDSAAFAPPPPSPPDTGGIPARPSPALPRLPSPQGSPPPPSAPEEARPTRPSPAPTAPSSQKDWPDRPPSREEERFAAGRTPVPRLASSPGRSPTREVERFVAGRSPVPRLPSPPEESAVVRSPAREDDRSAPRLASLLLQESPAWSPAVEAGGAAGLAPGASRKESTPLDGGRPPLPFSHADPIEHPSSLATSILNRAARDDQPAVTKVERGVDGADAERGSKAVSWIMKRQRRGKAVGRAVIGIRLSALVLSLVSFSVMAADKTKGWAGDTFDRYREYRFCITMNILTFIYSGFQVYAESHRLIYEKDIIRSPWRYYFDFAMDQVLAYLLMAASSAAATRTDDWVSNWGNDPFTVMANGSTAVSYLAFVAVAVSALISAHSLFARRS